MKKNTVVDTQKKMIVSNGEIQVTSCVGIEKGCRIYVAGTNTEFIVEDIYIKNGFITLFVLCDGVQCVSKGDVVYPDGVRTLIQPVLPELNFNFSISQFFSAGIIFHVGENIHLTDLSIYMDRLSNVENFIEPIFQLYEVEGDKINKLIEEERISYPLTTKEFYVNVELKKISKVLLQKNTFYGLNIKTNKNLFAINGVKGVDTQSSYEGEENFFVKHVIFNGKVHEKGNRVLGITLKSKDRL